MAALISRTSGLPVLALAALSVSSVGCQPDLGATSSTVVGLRFLAVSAEPPEAMPNTPVSYAALVVDGAGEQTDLPIDWAFCNAQKPLSDQGDVSAQCFTLAADYLAPLGVGATAMGALPTSACNLFGPDAPPAVADEPPGRPADPDLTGGYYQPVRLLLQTDAQTLLAAGESRILCGLPGATAETLQAFKQHYRVNTNPVLESVSLVATDVSALTPDDGASPGARVKAGQKVVFRAAWPDCPTVAACGDGFCSPGEELASCPDDCTTPVPCGGAEPFAFYDPQTREVTSRREAMTVSWFSTAGEFDQDRGGRSEQELERTTDNGWKAPSQPGPVQIWAVLRDNRAGVSWKRFRIDVE